ncbi:MAG: type II toxin-antitoxin system HicB family antitoxin [Acidimicrobiales bacterium]
MSTWTVVYEQTKTGWSAFVPALPGVGAAAATHEEAEQFISEAIALHIQGLAEDGLPIPDPHSVDIGQVELRQPA